MMYSGQADWLDNVDLDQVEEYAERAAPYVVAAITGQREVAPSPPPETEKRFRFDWKWGALAVLSGALLFSMLRSK